MQRRFISRLALGAGALVLAAGISGVTAVAANASDPTEPTPLLTVTYDVKGSTTLKKANVKVPLGPTKITVALDDTNAFLASLPLPPKTVSFKAFGYLPVKAKVYFTQVGPVTGNLAFEGDNTNVFSSAQYVVTLRDVYVGGQAAKVGDNCQTRYPITVNASNNGGPFDLGNGGALTATYDLGKFEHCGTSTDLTNIIVPSNNNSLTLNLSNLQVVNNDSPSTNSTLQKKVVAASKKK